MNRAARAGVALLCVAVLVLAAYGEASPAARASKDETVYVNLDCYGNVLDTFVVNAFKVPSSGTIYDYGVYENVKNLTDSGAPSIQDGYITWNVDPSDGTFYYQGEVKNAQIPWLLSLSYRLDGVQMDPQDLAGASGQFELTIDVASNRDAHPYFRDNFMAQVSVSLESQRCRNILAPDATVVTVGGTRTATFVVRPGASATFTLSADVTDFEMAAVSIAATKASSSLTAGIDELQVGLSQMSEGIGQLTSSTGQLKSGADQLSQGIGLLDDAASAIASSTPAISAGMADFEGGLTALGDSAGQMADASSAIREGLGELDDNSYPLINGYDAVEAGLKQMAEQKPAIQDGVEQLKENEPDLSQLTGATGQLVDGVAQIQAANAGEILALNAIKANFAAVPGLGAALDNVITIANGIGAGLTQTEGGLEQLGSGISSVSWGMDELYDSALQFGEGALDLADGAESLQDGMVELNSGLQGYTAGVGKLAQDYAQFDEGVSSARTGMGSLKDGFSSIRYGADSVFSAIGELGDGISALDQGASAFPEGVQQLLEGQEMLRDALATAGDEIGATAGMGQETTPVSFAAPGIVVPNSVQFVMRTPAIEKPAKVEAPEEVDENPGFFQRLLRLFGLD